METCDLTAPRYRAHVRYLTCPVPPERDGVCIGDLLRRGVGLSAAQIKRIKYLPDGIMLDGARVTTAARARAGQVLRLRLSDTARSSGIAPVQGSVDILYEDEDLLVVNKAPGVAVHPGMGQGVYTLGNFLLFYYDQEGIPADFHPVHRLDRGTSGLMVVAKHALAQDRLREELHSSAFDRTYLAVCDGVPPESGGSVDLPIGRSEGSVLRREVRPDGLSARTDYTVLREGHGRALLQLHLHTGRTHQIRVHMAALGCPLTGDFLYGTEDPSLIARAALHSAALTFRHPITGAQLSFSLPLPEDMAQLL